MRCVRSRVVLDAEARENLDVEPAARARASASTAVGKRHEVLVAALREDGVGQGVRSSANRARSAVSASPSPIGFARCAPSGGASP